MESIPKYLFKYKSINGFIISEYVHKEYNKWILECVRPRDVIIHYDDINVGYTFIEFCELPFFIYYKTEHASNSIQSENSTSTYELTFLD